MRSQQMERWREDDRAEVKSANADFSAPEPHPKSDSPKGASLGHDNRSDIVVRGVAVSSGRLEGAFRLDDTGQSVGRSR